MRDVIQKVLEAEAEAKRVVIAARDEAERIVSEARRQAQERVEEAHREGRSEAARIVEAALTQGQQAKQVLLAQASTEMERELQLDEAIRRAAEDAVLRCVCGHSVNHENYASGGR